MVGKYAYICYSNVDLKAASPDKTKALFAKEDELAEKNGVEIVVEDRAYEIRRCRGLERSNFGKMGFYHIFDQYGRDLTGPARFRHLRQAVEWLFSRLTWNAE